MRIAVISFHSSPLDQPGQGDAGGMNVYIRSVWKHLSANGFSADIYTRCRDQFDPETQELYPGVRVIPLTAGAPLPLPKEELPSVVPAFLSSFLRRARHETALSSRPAYDAFHAHYWLSGWVAYRAARTLRSPMVASFHTLARVKAQASSGTQPEAPERARVEARVVHRADRIVASTQTDAGQLVKLYGADPTRIRVLSPGVDTAVFRPLGRDKRAAERTREPGSRLVVFVGRTAFYKGPDIAIRTIAAASASRPDLMAPVALAIVGGSEGDPAIRALGSLAADLGVADRVSFIPAQPHDALADLYRQAEVLLMPSRSETFGLVAAEAMACGTPVIGAAVGGLTSVVQDRATGFLVEGHDPADYAARLVTLLSQPRLARRMSRAAAEAASRLSWARTAERPAGVYSELRRAGPTRAGSTG